MLQKDNLHHAYILEGSRHRIHDDVVLFCENDLCFPIKANPDFWYEEFDRFSISDARNLREMQLRKTTDRGKKIFIIAFNFITREAQNALLKVLEEPTEGTHILLVVPSAHMFLDTVISRAHIITHESKDVQKQVDAQKFIDMSLKKRQDFVTKLIKEIKDDKKSKIDAIELIRGLQQVFHARLQEKKERESSRILSELQKVESYLHDTSSSVKMLMEYVMVLV